ncbi:MAG: hypothetical protein HKN29_05675 [Rhodothermales bacterium]|nr:hypothetical protein [Rhodothermales bacterium]
MRISAHPSRRHSRPRLYHSLVLLLALSAGGCESFVVLSDNLKEEFLAWEFGMFIHFNMATFNDREWANGYEDPDSFAPTSLDVEQWADAAVSAGMTYAVLTVKHTGGWALWDSGLTNHDVTAFQNYQDGKGDLVREFVDAFRSRGLKVGFYYCLPGDYDGRFGNVKPKGAPPMNGLPPEAQGRRLGFVKDQLSELLTRYGAVDLIWIDQYRTRLTSKRDWNEIRNHIRSLQPTTFIVANNSRKNRETDIHSYEYPLYQAASGLPPEGNARPAEVSDVLGPSWFWNTSPDQANLKSAADVVDRLSLVNARRANYLLNVAPDTTGQLPARAVQRLAEVGALRRSQ